MAGNSLNRGFFIISAASFLFWSCYYDSKEYLFPEISTNCDTTTITYSRSVVPVLENYCLSCHNTSSAGSLGGNIILEGYSNCKLKADDGSLLGSVSHQSGYSYMPKNSAKLDDCSISIIELWIKSGSPNN